MKFGPLEVTRFDATVSVGRRSVTLWLDWPLNPVSEWLRPREYDTNPRTGNRVHVGGGVVSPFTMWGLTNWKHETYKDGLRWIQFGPIEVNV